MSLPIIPSAFPSENANLGRTPVVFDILGPDWETSLLPAGMRLVLHVNPTSMSISYTRAVERIQTRGGFVEQHWGDAITKITFDMATGGFMRLYSGLSNITNPSYGGTRRETISYDKYLDMLALFKNNGAVFASNKAIVLQGMVKITFDGGVYLGWFESFSVTESADKPYQFTMNANFEVQKEIVSWRSTISSEDGLASSSRANPNSAFSEPPLDRSRLV